MQIFPLSAAVGAVLVVSSLPISASAAGPFVGAKMASPQLSENAAYRRCAWRHGVRYCGYSRYRRYGSGYGFSYGNPKAEFYRPGSHAWWDAMEREGRTGGNRR
jgi:hypothetical protein